MFHLRFTLPALAGVAIVTQFTPLPSDWWLQAGSMFMVLILIVVTFTSPWDNAAVKWRTWEFPEDRIWFRIAFLPIEEYAFFVLQTLIVGLLTVVVLAHLGGQSHVGSITIREAVAAIVFVSTWFLLGAVYRRARLMSRRLTYSWHLLYWFLPVVVVQWIIASEVLLPNAFVILLSAGIVGTYLVVADIVAVRHGIWFFDEEQITGIKVFSVLPWEEAAFFYITSLLVSQSTVLLLPPMYSSG
jgi:putative membrane protein